MTDPFSDLERELLGAHARDHGARRHLRSARRGLPAAASVTAAAAVIAWFGGLAPAGDPERAAAPGPQTEEGWTAYAPLSETGDPVPGACATPYEPRASGDPVPDRLLELMSVLRRRAVDEDALPLPAFMFSSQAVSVYDGGRRRFARGEDEVFLWPAEIVARTEVAGEQRSCDPPEGDTAPGVCMALMRAQGAFSACFTPEEIRGGEAFVDRKGEVAGLAPDGARLAQADGRSARVEDNFFVLPSEAGPDTEIAFVE